MHGNDLAPEEIEWIGQQEGRLTVIFCPRTHSYFAHEPYPLAQLIAAGVRVALGTDSRASSPDLDVLAELRQVGRRYPEIAPQRLLQMATCDAAEALGLGEGGGTSGAGQRADLLELRSTERIVDPTEMVVRHDALERRVWYGGACHVAALHEWHDPHEWLTVWGTKQDVVSIERRVRSLAISATRGTSGQGRVELPTPRIFSPVLYQLNYLSLRDRIRNRAGSAVNWTQVPNPLVDMRVCAATMHFIDAA